MENEIKNLKEQLKNLHEHSTLRRPIVIELCGSPKSGKSTCIEAVKNILRECELNVSVIHEKAKICPLSNKIDPMFNFWTVTNSINELSELCDNNYLYDTKHKIDIILIDRGVFDSLIWFDWLNANSAISDKDLLNVVNLLTSKEIKLKFDKVLVFKGKEEYSLKREPGSSFIYQKSIIMNPEVLKGLNKSIDNVIDKYGNSFNYEEIAIEENFDSQINKVILKVLNYIITQFDERIGYINKKHLKLPNHSFTDTFYSLIPESTKLLFENRIQIEDDENVIQLIPIAVIIKDNSILCVRKTKNSFKDSSKKLLSPEKNKHLFYVGGHVRDEDTRDATDIISILRNALHREIKEELNLTLNIPETVIPYIIFSNSMEKSRQHLACCWVIEIGPQKSCIQTNGTELVKNKKSNISGSFIPFNQINENLKLEDWSKMIFTDILKNKLTENELLHIPPRVEQYTLF